MLFIADIIVDVPSMQTDQPFSYIIPENLQDVIEVGMRVEVPFGNGNRHIQGFIVALKKVDSIENDLKPIINVLDLYPVLNDELLELADEMKETTYSFKITCLQTMLPSVMRSSYKKFVTLTDNQVPQHVRDELFLGLAEIEWEEAKESPHFPELLRLKQDGKVDVRYEITTKNKVKTKRVIRKSISNEVLEKERETIRKNAKQKLRLLSFLMEIDDKEYSIKELMEEHQINRTAINDAKNAGWLVIEEKEVYRDPYAFHNFKKDTPLVLNDEQQVALDTMVTSMDQQKSDVFLLEGVTGSGKTEIYLQAIAHALEKNQTAIMLVPEISLTPQTVTRFKKRFGDEVAVLHSGLSQGEKYDEWRKIERKEARVVVGARSAIFAPLKNIGLIVIDEEHEGSYKQDETPRYHAKDLAVWRGKYHHCPVLLGSATPSLEARARAQKGVYQLLTLEKRAVSKSVLPKIKVIDMREEMKQSLTTSFSGPLLEKLKEGIEKKEQTVLMLNRRGYSSFVMCRDCGYVLPCPNCDISLTLHMDTKQMKCHYCGHEERIPYRCPVCDGDKIRYYGTGTQKIEEELKEILPEARVIRMDVDTTRKKGAHEKLLKQFGNHEADILLGTQMIAKGLDFPNVTLVGVLNADTALNLPDFRSSEKTFQLLTQVSGRAGRGEKAGEVLIQTFNPGHYAIQLAKLQNYEQFYQQEMKIRHQGNYPPFYFTTQLVVSHEEEHLAAKKMYEIVNLLKKFVSPQAIVLGPTPKSVARMNKRYYYQTVIKYKNEPNLSKGLKIILEESQKEIRNGLRITIDMEPQHFI
ncbi:MAG: primosomal protein N' [Vagococcus sp.]|uniref:primosomal protein N' n=1 Tax=Vagococcus sp. TaxID=1933889 RepID=UPI002FC79CE6